MSYVVPQPRALPPGLEQRSPTQAMAELMRLHAAQQAASRAEAEAVLSQAGKLVVAVALACYRKRGTAGADELRGVEDALADHGVELITHVGEQFTDEMAEVIDVIDWVPEAPGVDPGGIVEAFEPEVRWRERILHRAKVVCLLEASHDSASVQPGESA